MTGIYNSTYPINSCLRLQTERTLFRKWGRGAEQVVKVIKT